ncbi:MAG: LuxR C-terminal-related transcriptional regulator [Snowella sp.]|nr:LuxR C-terminal-related transcriptional regulator [Snowella sp.]
MCLTTRLSFLSPNERRIFDLRMEGKSQKEICDKARISPSSASRYLAVIRKKLEFETDVEMVAAYYKSKIETLTQLQLKHYETRINSREETLVGHHAINNSGIADKTNRLSQLVG